MSERRAFGRPVLPLLLARNVLQTGEQAGRGGIQRAPARHEDAEFADHLRIDDRVHLQAERSRQPALCPIVNHAAGLGDSAHGISRAELTSTRAAAMERVTLILLQFLQERP